MTNEDWKYVEDRLFNPFGSVNLLIDRYNMTLKSQAEKILHDEEFNQQKQKLLNR